MKTHDKNGYHSRGVETTGKESSHLLLLLNTFIAYSVHMYWTGKLFAGKDQWIQSLIYQLSSPTLSSFQGLRGEQRLGDLLGICLCFLAVCFSERRKLWSYVFNLFIYSLFLCLAYWRVLFFFFLTLCKLPGWSVRKKTCKQELYSVANCRTLCWEEDRFTVHV